MDTSVNLNDIEKSLDNSPWLGGATASAKDRTTLQAVKAAGITPSAKNHPKTFAWFCLCGRFTQSVQDTWTVGASVVAAGGAKEDKPKEKKLAKQERLARMQQQAAGANAQATAADPAGVRFGDMELNRSQGDPEDRHKEAYVEVRDISEALAG